MWRSAVAPHPHRGFTLVEMLIVIVLISIIAGIAVMHVGSSSEEAALSALFTNEQMLQGAIDRYKIDHGGLGPQDVTSDGLPQLTQKTNVRGDVGNGPAHVFGPYLHNEVPLNPVTNSRAIQTTSESPPSDLTDTSFGWVYNPSTGQIWGVLGLATDSKLRMREKTGI